MGVRGDELFSRQMRQVTREAHDISDALVNTKLALALFDDRVWAEGLQIFYELFAFLERNVPTEILPKEFYRKEAFENDLAYFLGEHWKEEYSPRRAVQDYLDHLEEVKKENPDLLIAYVYHLYMGLLSGAQILQKKRSIARKLNPLSSGESSTIGAEATHFANHTASDLKRKMREILNEKAKSFDEQTKKRVLEESVKLFELNNKVVSTVQGVNQIAFKKLIIGLLFCMLTYLVYKMFFP